MDKIGLCAGEYRAEFAPDFGGNCICLEHSSGASLLRTPVNAAAMQATPLLYGMPLLIPPNRIRGGKFTWRGREYRFPVNEPQYGTHCHGSLYRTPADGYSVEGNAVTFWFDSAGKKEYAGFPHPCRLELSYQLGNEGLVQRLTLLNRGSEFMPFAVAFHTTLALTFEGGNAEGYALYAPVVRKYVRDMNNFLPTGEILEDFPEKKAMNAGRYFPAKHAITDFMEIGGTVCRLMHLTSGNAIEYRADAAYRFRHFFNGGSRAFICVEPQTCRIDGINVWGENADNGIIAVPPRGSVSLECSLRFVRRK